jgi:serine/threonine-protein kinase
MGPDDSGVVPIGSVLDGRYRIDAVLGKGGMGRVYKGEHTGIGRTVAIKVLHTALGGNREAMQRFQREALASGRLDHPNIVGVSDFGVIESGGLYLVMEALEGEALGARLERDKRIPWPEALEIVRGVLAGLRHAHDKGVVHRDIKPDNIFLARKDGEQVVKILDFGIAKLYAGNADDPASTRAGLTVGTPAYLSPEQAVGGAITPAADIYSTSIVLYEMLAGRAPFEDEDPLAMLTAHVGREPPPFAQVAPGLELPYGLEALVQRGLQKIAAERVPTAVAYMSSIDDILRGAGRAVPRTAMTPPHGSESMAIPAGPYAPLANATPMPFLNEIGTAPTASALTPMPAQISAPSPRVSRTISVAESGAPIPRKWLAIGGLLLAAGLVGALVLVVAGRGDKDDHAQTPTNLPIPGEDRDMKLKALLHDLEAGKTCPERREAVKALEDLGDPRAIPDLKHWRHRMYGGLAGIGESDANACLTKDADAAIKSLGGK